jgi:hypothetical protein
MPNADTARLIALVEQETGYRVTLGTTDTAVGDAEMVSAAAAHPAHVINVSSRSLAVADYITAVQCVMLLTMWSHPRGVPQFQLVDEKIRYAVGKVGRWKGLSRYPKHMVDVTARAMFTGLLHQLLSTPSELLGIEYCYRECKSLRQQQADAVNASIRRNTQSLTPQVRELAPPDLYERNQSMCAALARFWCDLIGSEVAMLPYKSIGMDKKAEVLLAHWRESAGSLGERSVATVDKWADWMGLRSFYTWGFRPK